VVYSLFSCHKCTCWSHPILTFLTFHVIEFATNTPSVLFTRNIFGKWLYLLMAFYYRCNFIHMPSLVWIVWKTNEILHIVQSVALGVCFSIHAITSLLSCSLVSYSSKFPLNTCTCCHSFICRPNQPGYGGAPQGWGSPGYNQQYPGQQQQPGAPGAGDPGIARVTEYANNEWVLKCIVWNFNPIFWGSGKCFGVLYIAKLNQWERVLRLLTLFSLMISWATSCWLRVQYLSKSLSLI